MRKLIGLLILLLAVAALSAQYYNGVINLTGQALYNGLRTLISTNTNTDYDESKEQMFGYFDNVNGYVRCVYTGQDWSVPQGGMPNQNQFNCEHTYAQSWFTGTETNVKKADLHHLFPTNAQVNSSRGNLPFDVVANHSSATTYVTYNGYHSYRGNNASGYTVFEPADQHKGNLARALLYFNVRYNNTLTQQNVNMIPTLLLWHVLDPVDTAEEARNQNIYSYQTNRNPFVDHPEFVQRIWGPVDNDDSYYTTPPSFTLGEVYPNPFKQITNISYSLDKDVMIGLEVYNLKGQLVRKIYHGIKQQGDQKASWDGTNMDAVDCPSGVYLIRLAGRDGAVFRKVLKR